MESKCWLPLLALTLSVSGCATALPVAVQCPVIPEPPEAVQAVLSAQQGPSWLESVQTSLTLLRRLIEQQPLP